MNLQVQRQMTNSLALTVAYVGSLSREQFFAPDNNYPSFDTNYGGLARVSGCPTGATIEPTTNNSQCRRPYEPYGTIYQLGSGQTSSFHSLQTTVTKRMANHLSIQAYHMWSRTMSSVELEQTGPGGNDVEDAANLKAEFGRADNDYRNLAAVAIIWQPDYYSGHPCMLGGLINGWEINPLTQFSSGVSFQVTNGADANLDGLSGATNDRAELVGNPFAGEHSRYQWFNTAAFKQNVATPGVPVDGNEPRNYLTGPGSKVINLTRAHTFPIAERVNFRFSAEALNALNTANWSTPSTTITQPTTFGVINSAGHMREIQFGGKVLF